MPSESHHQPPRLARFVDRALEASVVGSFTRPGLAIRSRLMGWEEPAKKALAGRNVVVTGASSGIGREVAIGVAEAGARVHLVGRDQQRLEDTARTIRDSSGRADTHPADLGRLDEVRSLAEALDDGTPIDRLIHVAGALSADEVITDDGIEMTVAVHVVAPFLLTARLHRALRRSPDPRVITMTSGGFYTQPLDVDVLLRPSSHDGVKAYARAKRAQVSLTQTWARRDRAVNHLAVHPGWADTPGLQASLPGFARGLRLVLRTAAQGADSAVWLATADDVGPSGSLWHDRQPRRDARWPVSAPDRSEVDRLWREVAGLAGVDAEDLPA